MTLISQSSAMQSLPPPPQRKHHVARRNSATHSGEVPPATSASQPHSELVRKRGGRITVPGKLTPPAPENRGSPRLTKLLLNVNIQRSFGPLQVVMSPERTVIDLIKAAIEIYVKEKRRPLLTETDTRRFELHYSQFSLESLKAEEKLINLGSRNFFLYPKPKNVANSSCSDKAKAATISPVLLLNFINFLM